jgi:hypothetical protein
MFHYQHTHILQRCHGGRGRQASHKLKDNDGSLPLHLMTRVVRGAQQLRRLLVQPLDVALVAHPLLHAPPASSESARGSLSPCGCELLIVK